MNNNRYPFYKISEEVKYEFQSEGAKGVIKKRVLFRLIRENPLTIYNIGFGDLVNEKEPIDDRIISNNGDREQILMTVTDIISAFIHEHVDALTLIVGSTESRTRLYQMWISRFFHRFDHDFSILGYVEKHWQPFKKGVNYKSFLIKRK